MKQVAAHGFEHEAFDLHIMKEASTLPQKSTSSVRAQTLRATWPIRAQTTTVSHSCEDSAEPPHASHEGDMHA